MHNEHNFGTCLQNKILRDKNVKYPQTLSGSDDAKWQQ